MGSTEKLLVGNENNIVTNSSIINLSSNHSGTFRSGVEINNDNKVVAVDQASGLSAIRLWDANLPGSFDKTLGTAQQPFQGLVNFPKL